MAKRVVSVFTGVAILLIAAQVPAGAKGTLTYVASGGDLDNPVSFDSTLFDAVWSRDRGPYWREESSVPALPSGIRYRIDIYFDEVQPRQLVEQWIYVPAASGAIEVKPNAYARTSDGAIIRWRASLQISTRYSCAPYAAALHSPWVDSRSRSACCSWSPVRPSVYARRGAGASRSPNISRKLFPSTAREPRSNQSLRAPRLAELRRKTVGCVARDADEKEQAVKVLAGRAPALE